MCQKSVEESDLLYSCICFCSSSVSGCNESKDFVECSVCVCMGDVEDEVEMVSVGKGCEVWGRGCGGGGGWEGCDVAFVDDGIVDGSCV
jgi:hypothetical protein